MFNLGILDLLIGMAFIYFLLSIICSAIVEIIAQVLDLRGKYLEKWIMDTFGSDLGRSIYSHYLVKSLTSTKYKVDYIPSEVFYKAVADKISEFKENKEWQSYFDNEQNPDKKLLQKKFVKWYDQAMGQLSGYYKKKIVSITFLVAVTVTIITNANTIVLMKYLTDNPRVTEKLVETAKMSVNDSIYSTAVVRLKEIKSKLKTDTTDTTEKDLTQVINDINENRALIKSTYTSLSSYGLPLGIKYYSVKYDDNCFVDILNKILGLLLTAIALSLGAPFWFDLLNKLVNIRQAGKRPATPAPKP
jgi:hypothetical protein